MLAPAHPPWRLCKSEPRTPVSGPAFRRFELMDTTYGALNPALEHLRDNRTSGAIDLALETLDVAQSWLAAGRSPLDLARELAAMHPAIATVRNMGALLSQRSDDLPAALRDVRRSLVEGNRRIAEKLKELLPVDAAVITLSNSSTVRDALLAIRPRSVRILESLPGGEGAEMAAALRKGSGRAAGLANVAVIPDSAMGNAVPRIDCALVGIDTFDRAGTILHKLGTLPLALCCHHYKKPFYAAGHSFKFTDREFSGLPEPETEVENQRFDCTPAELITQRVDEK